MSDNEAAQRLHAARESLFKTIFEERPEKADLRLLQAHFRIGKYWGFLKKGLKSAPYTA